MMLAFFRQNRSTVLMYQLESSGICR